MRASQVGTMQEWGENGRTLRLTRNTDSFSKQFLKIKQVVVFESEDSIGPLSLDILLFVVDKE